MNLSKIKNKIEAHRKAPTNYPFFDPLYRSSILWLILGIISVFWLNHTYYHYNGNNFLSHNSIYIFSMVVYAYLSCYFFDNLKLYIPYIHDFALLSTSFLIIALATNACQLTPFPLIDNYLASHEYFSILDGINWTKTHPNVRYFLIRVYNSLDPMIFFCCFGFLFLGFRKVTHDFCRYMLLTVTIGYTIYFFFPSCGPANVFPHHLFLKVQHANHIKFSEIHQGLIPSTNQGGLIALPSFHVLWAWGCARCFLFSRKLFILAIFWFISICLSCFLLGWHYSLDILVSILIIICSEQLLKNN